MNTRWLILLYPRAWRERYGEELLAFVGDRLNWRAALDIGRAAIVQRLVFGAKLMEANRVPDPVGPTMFGGLRELCVDLRRDLLPWIPWRAAAVWGIALGATFVCGEVAGLYGFSPRLPSYLARPHWLDLVGVAICFSAGFQAAWRSRDFGHGGLVALTAIVVGFAVAIVGDVSAVLIISRFRQLDLIARLYDAIEVPLPIMLMLGGSLGVTGAALAVGLAKFRHAVFE